MSINIKINIKYVSQFHIPTTLSPRDRGFTYPGVKQTVKVDHTKLVDTLGEYSKYACNKTMNGVYDECAYREVGRNSFRVLQYLKQYIVSSRNTNFQNMAAQYPGCTSHLSAIQIAPRVL